MVVRVEDNPDSKSSPARTADQKALTSRRCPLSIDSPRTCATVEKELREVRNHNRVAAAEHLDSFFRG